MFTAWNIGTHYVVMCDRLQYIKLIKLKNKYFIITVETLLQRQKLLSLGIIVNYNNHTIYEFIIL